MFEENPKKAELDTGPLIAECVSTDQSAKDASLRLHQCQRLHQRWFISFST